MGSEGRFPQRISKDFEGLQVPPRSHSKGFGRTSKHKTEVQDMQIKAKVGYRTAPGELSCTPLLVGHPCPVTHFCHKKPSQLPKSLRDKSPKEGSKSTHFGAGLVSKSRVQDRSQKWGTGQGCPTKRGLQDRSLGRQMAAVQVICKSSEGIGPCNFGSV